MWMALHVAFRKHIHLTAIFLHRSSSLDKCLKEVCVALEVTRSEDSQVAHNIVRCSLILKALRDEDQSFSSTPSTQTQLMWSEGTWGKGFCHLGQGFHCCLGSGCWLQHVYELRWKSTLNASFCCQAANRRERSRYEPVFPRPCTFVTCSRNLVLQALNAEEWG